jgi:hypothetical protein
MGACDQRISAPGARKAHDTRLAPHFHHPFVLTRGGGMGEWQAAQARDSVLGRLAEVSNDKDKDRKYVN